MAPSFSRFQTKELRIWTIQRNAEPDDKPGSIQQMENRFRSAGIGESEIVIHLYPKRWTLVKHNREYRLLRYYEIIKGIEINEFIADTIWICQVFWRMKTLDLYGISQVFEGCFL